MSAIALGLLFVLLIGPAIWLPSLLGWRLFRTQSARRRGVAAILGDQTARWLYVGLGGLVTLVGCGFICSGAMGLLLGDKPRGSHVPGRSELPELQPTYVLSDFEDSNPKPVFSPDGTRLLTGGSKLQVWDVATGSLQEDLFLPPVHHSGMTYRVNQMAAAHSYVVLSLFGNDPALSYWDWKEDTRNLTVVPIPIKPTALAMSADGRYAIALENYPFGSDEMRQRRVSFVMVDFQQQMVYELPEPRIGGVAFLGQSNEAVLASPQGLHVLDAATRQIVRTIDPPDGQDWRGCLDLSVSADGQHAVACDRQALWVWDLSAGQLVQRLPLAERFADEVELSADGRTFVTSGFVDDGALGVWQRAGLRPRQVLVPRDEEEAPYISLAISPHARYVAAMQRGRCLL